MSLLLCAKGRNEYIRLNVPIREWIPLSHRGNAPYTTSREVENRLLLDGDNIAIVKNRGVNLHWVVKFL